jgi:hypothetical protein
MTANIQTQSAFKAIEVLNEAKSFHRPLWIRKSGDLRKATNFESFTLKIMTALKIWPNWKIQAREQIYKKITAEINVLQSFKDPTTVKKVEQFVNEVTSYPASNDAINTKIQEITNSDLAFGDALKFANQLQKISIPENYQSILNVAKYIKGVDASILKGINTISTELNETYQYSIKETVALAPLVFLLKRELMLDSKDAIKISQVASKLSKKNKESSLLSAANLIENIRELDPALPSGYDIKKLLTTNFKVDLKIPKEKNTIFLEFLKDSAGNSISLDDEIPDFCLRDLNRSHIKFKVGKKEKYLKPGHQKEMIEEITNLDSNATVRSTLCKAIFQAGGNGIITSYAQIFEKGRSGNFTIIYTLYEKHFALVDPESGKNYPINSNFESSKPASKNDFTSFSKFTIELNHADLEVGLYNPIFISSTLDLTIKPNFMI